MSRIVVLFTVAIAVMHTPEPGAATANPISSSGDLNGSVYVIPVREDIMPPLVYLVRRGVKEAMDQNAALLILDMDTNGGRVDITEEIIQIIDQFPGPTATFVNRKAISAGAFISVATEHIFMAEQSVIGAAAPVMINPLGGGAEDMPSTMEIKVNSAVSALVRSSAQKNGHNVDVVEAMIDKDRKLEIDGEVLCDEGRILTLTNREAEARYGDPPVALLSSGTVQSIEEIAARLGFESAPIVRVEPTGVEQLATWINRISPILLMVGLVGLYIEFKTPGFGLPGIAGLGAFALYFLGGYVAGLSGVEWIAVFVGGLILVALEIFAFPGTAVLGILGAGMILGSLLMAMVDIYPGMPSIPSLPQLSGPVQDLGLAFLGAIAAAIVLARFLPRTAAYDGLVSQGTSGSESVARMTSDHSAEIGQVGETVTALRPGGKARFGDALRDVITRGEMIDQGATIRIIGHSGSEAVVEAASAE